MKRKKLIITLGVLLLVILLVLTLLIIFINKSKKITDLEQLKIEETSKNTMLFMEEIDNKNSTDIDRYIAYALEYSYNMNDKETLTVKEIKELIASKFTIELSEEKINSIGITPILLEKNVYHNPSENIYYIDKSNLTQPMIAKIPVIKYEISSMKKSKNKFIVTYEKYVVSNPYEVLNYYNDMTNNLTEEERTNYIPYDTSDIYNYLTCKGKITSVKEAINKDNIEKIGKIDSTIEVTYIIKDNKMLVEKITNK